MSRIANPRSTLLTLTALTEWFEVSGCQRRDRDLKLGRMIEESERNRLVCVSCVSDEYSWRYDENVETHKSVDNRMEMVISKV
jgi:protein-arginine kinase activator protein McsA